MTEGPPDALPRPPHGIQCLKSEGGRSVWLIQRPGESPRTLKIWPLTPWMLLRFMLGSAPAQRQARGGRRLEHAGIPTPRIALPPGIRRTTGRLAVELELDYVEGISLHAVMRRPERAPPSSQPADRLAAALGDLIGALAARRVFHRDIKPSNIIMATEDERRSQLWLIDPAGARVMHRRDRGLARMLANLSRAAGDLPLASHAFAHLRLIVLRRALRGAARPERKNVIRLLRQAGTPTRQLHPSGASHAGRD